MGKTKIIGFYGYSGSGKTSLLERITRELTRRNIRVSVIKQGGKNADLDDKGKDTERLIKAGAMAAAFLSENQTILFLDKECDFWSLVRIIEQAAQPQIILVEGANDPKIKKIRIGEKPERENTIYAYGGNYDELMNIVLKEA